MVSILIIAAVAIGIEKYRDSSARTTRDCFRPCLPSLMEAESAFRRGDFLSSAIAFETFFESGSTTNEMDRLRLFGVAQSLSGIATQAASTATFKELIRFSGKCVCSTRAHGAFASRQHRSLEVDKLSHKARFGNRRRWFSSAADSASGPRISESAFDAADYATAAKSYEAYLQSNPKRLKWIGFTSPRLSQALSGVLTREVASNGRLIN